MINGFEYRDNLPKCPERSDRWLSPSNDECEEYDENDNEPSDEQESSNEPNDDELAYQEFLDEFSKK